jgi:hydroxyquinol 1,2-dioxygenase
LRNFDENSITDAVIGRVNGATDERTRQIGVALVKHLHAFIKEIEPTEAEWQAGIGFLTEVGAMCSPTRQEFILLSDTLGVSMLVDGINHRHSGTATDTTVLGPFYVQDPPVLPLGADIAAGEEGTPLLVEGTVRSADGTPLAGATVDTWHSDSEGYYDVQKPDATMRLRARFKSDASGHFTFRTIVPSYYPIPTDGPVGRMLTAQGRHPYRPAHIHFMIAAPGHCTLVTHVFIAGDPYLDSDAVFGVKDALIRDLEPALERPGFPTPARRLTYDFALAQQKA